MAFADHPTLNPTNWIRDLKAQVPRKLVRDAWNRARYGADAPLSDEAIYIDPLAVQETCRTMPGGPRLRRRQSGMVVAGEPDSNQIVLTLMPAPLKTPLQLDGCTDLLL